MSIGFHENQSKWYQDISHRSMNVMVALEERAMVCQSHLGYWEIQSIRYVHWVNMKKNCPADGAAVKMHI